MIQVKKKLTVALVIAGALLVLQIIVWPLPIYYWLAGECTKELLCWQGQKLLTVNDRGSWPSQTFKKWKVLSSRQLPETEVEDTVFLIVVFTPWELNALSYQERIAYVNSATQKAVQAGADLICDSSAADRARQSERDHSSVKLLKKSGIARAVIFDGGHHLPNLSLEPEMLICPVIGGPNKKPLIAHGFCRDALPLEKLMQIKELLGLNSAIVTFPRLTGYLKSPQAMGTLCQQSAMLLAQTEPEARSLMQPVVSWGPTFSFFAGEVLLWRPEPEQLLDLEEEISKLTPPGHKAKTAYLAVEGDVPFESSLNRQLVTLGRSSWQIMLNR